jgi:hypothetical protein
MGCPCSWYDTRPEECGDHDGFGFVAATMCCACKGGKVRSIALKTGLTWDVMTDFDATE